MYRFLVVLYLAAGCGFGMGAVDGPSRQYRFEKGDGAWYKDSSGTHVDTGGQKWRRGAGTLLGYGPVGGGALVGFRRGISWVHGANGETIDSGRTADYFLQGYWGALSLGVGFTSESGRTSFMQGTIPLPGDLGYEGWYVEPAYALYGNGLIYLAGTFAYIFDGETTSKLDSRSSTGYADARGLRPGLRFATLGFPVGPVSLKVSIDVRYLITPKAEGATGSYGGLSTAFALNFIL